jgi:acyl-CoA synthetase (AMP-forming)/AMP-acid ligase II
MNAVEYCLLHGLKLAGPEHPAILCAQESLSYGALAARVSQFAAGLREAGVRPSDRVGMLMLDTPDLIALHLGAMAAGAIAVAMSSRANAAELAQILAIVRPAVVVVDAEFAGVAAGVVTASSPNTRLIRRDHELGAWKASNCGAIRIDACGLPIGQECGINIRRLHDVRPPRPLSASGEGRMRHPLTSGQPPSFSGRNASAAGMVARIFM